MLEAGVDLLTISKLLGHASFITTMIYLHVRQQHFDRAPSPIDWLPVRHCPQCSGARRADWTDRNSELILPGIDYFQVVFTLPDKLSRLVLGNRRELYRLLFRSAWRALKQELEKQNIDPAALLMLHTWNQELGHHPQ